MSDFFQLINVSKTFDVNKKIKVLKNLTFNFKKGKIYSIVGPSGSGDSFSLPISGAVIFNPDSEQLYILAGISL